MIDLPHPKTHEQILDFCKPDFVAQLKVDGVRLALVYGEDCVPEFAVTKGGQQVAVPASVHDLPKMPPGSVLDGELVGAGNWSSAQSSLRDLFLGRPAGDAAWVCFAYLADVLQVTEGFTEGIAWLEERGFPVLRPGPVAEVWEEARRLELEGVVVRVKDADPAESAGWKVKFPQELNVVVHRGKALLLRNTGQPVVVASMPRQADGLYRVSCEGVATTGRLRAARVVGPALGQDVSYRQLDRLRR